MELTFQNPLSCLTFQMPTANYFPNAVNDMKKFAYWWPVHYNQKLEKHKYSIVEEWQSRQWCVNAIVRKGLYEARTSKRKEGREGGRERKKAEIKILCPYIKLYLYKLWGRG